MDALQMTLLFDYYGELLTDRQRMCFDLRHNQDLSLAEIAQEYAEFGLISGVIMALLGNATFVLLDLLLNKIKNRLR